MVQRTLPFGGAEPDRGNRKVQHIQICTVPQQDSRIAHGDLAGLLGGVQALVNPAETGPDFKTKVIGLPASIDNDIALTGLAIGVDTAMNTIVEACDKISDTASAHDRTFIVEIGRAHV